MTKRHGHNSKGWNRILDQDQFILDIFKNPNLPGIMNSQFLHDVFPERNVSFIERSLRRLVRVGQLYPLPFGYYILFDNLSTCHSKASIRTELMKAMRAEIDRVLDVAKQRLEQRSKTGPDKP